MIVESGQTCDFKRADDFFGLLFASLERSHFVLRLIRKYKIPEMRELRARLPGRVTVAHQLVIARRERGALALTGVTEMIFIITGSVSDHDLLAEKVRPLVPGLRMPALRPPSSAR